jgi:hypothetical protein
LAKRVQECVGNNSLAIEPIPGDNSYPGNAIKNGK